MADLLLAHGYFLFEDEKERQIMKPYPPLGLLYVSGWLRRAGFSVEVFDTTFASRAQLTARLAQTPGGVLGIYTNLMTRASVLDIVKRAKELRWTVVLGGPEAANHTRQYIDHGADVVVIGEGEVTLQELIPRLAKDGAHRLDGVDGIVYRDESGQIIKNRARAQIEDIDTIPWPDREQIDIPAYVDVWRTHHGMGSVNLITARGCPYKCNWCSHAVFGYSHRRRSPIDCADEVQHIHETYKPDQVWYADDVFTINHKWLYKYSDELKRRNLHLPFETISRADRMMKEEVMKTLADMGCYRIWIGSESGSQRILDAMERGVKVEQVQWATKTAQRYGIKVGMFLMWGYEGETMDDIAATVDHVKKANPDVFFTTVAYPITNTKFYDVVADRLVRPKNWAATTDRDYGITSQKSRAYYKLADQWLFNEVAAERMQTSDPDAASEKLAVAAQARAEMLQHDSGAPEA